VGATEQAIERLVVTAHREAVAAPTTHPLPLVVQQQTEATLAVAVVLPLLAVVVVKAPLGRRQLHRLEALEALANQATTALLRQPALTLAAVAGVATPWWREAAVQAAVDMAVTGIAVTTVLQGRAVCPTRVQEAAPHLVILLPPLL